MSYPPQYRPAFDFAQAINRGDLPSATELAIELFNAATSINQAIMFIRSFATSNQKIKPAQLRATTNVVEDEQTATAGQTEVLYSGGVTVDASTATVGVFVNGDRLAPSDVTVQSDRVVVTPALSGGETVLLEIHDNADSVFAKLGSISANLGASLVGIEDVAGYYASANVEDALEEIYEAFSTLVTDLGDLSKYLKADEAVPWEVDQDAGGYKLTNGAAGTEPTDFVILQQLDDIVEQFVDLGGRFLPIAGGVMNGTINMAGNSITDLFATPTTPIGDPGYSTVARYPATKEYVDLIEQSITGGGGFLDDYLPRDGSAAMLAALPFGGFKGVGAADPTDPQDVSTKNSVDTKEITSFPTSETNTALVLKPDGGGGVGWQSLPTTVPQSNEVTGLSGDQYTYSPSWPDDCQGVLEIVLEFATAASLYYVRIAFSRINGGFPSFGLVSWTPTGQPARYYNWYDDLATYGFEWASKSMANPVAAFGRYGTSDPTTRPQPDDSTSFSMTLYFGQVAGGVELEIRSGIGEDIREVRSHWISL